MNSDTGMAFISKVSEETCEEKNFERDYIRPRLHTGTGAVERAMQTPENLIFANLENNIGFTESINLALRVMRVTIHTGL